MCCLITGGAGFIGSNIAEKLLQHGKRVRILDNFSTGKRENLSFAAPGSIDVHEGDIRMLKDCREAMEGIDFVFHHAALASVPRSVEDPLLNHEINVTGTLNLLIAARDAGVKRFIFASSSAVYGEDPSLPDATVEAPAPKAEGMRPRPLSPYGLSKMIGEETCRLFYNLYGLETISLRYFNVFGRRQDPRSEYAAVIPKFIESVLIGKKPVIFGDGLQSRDFVFVDDVVEANLKSCVAPSAALGRAFNIACSQCLTLLDILGNLKRLTAGNKIEPVFAPAKQGDVKHSLADITLAGRFLDFRPRISFEEGLEETVAWYKTQVPGGDGFKRAAEAIPGAAALSTTLGRE